MQARPDVAVVNIQNPQRCAKFSKKIEKAAQAVQRATRKRKGGGKKSKEATDPSGGGLYTILYKCQVQTPWGTYRKETKSSIHLDELKGGRFNGRKGKEGVVEQASGKTRTP